jgi:YXWGXW repeat-containing protein
MKLFRQGVSLRALALTVLALSLMSLGNGGTAAGQVSVGISVNFAPPELPVYEQPLCPGEGYIWTPGYWAWDPDYGDYYWVPGTWVLAPQPGYLWTPPYWGWNGVAFVFHEGYWGSRVGFYGGINYGYGYTGRGYYGGRWDRDRFYYNRNVNNINVTQIHNVYNTTVVNNVNVTRVSYNGGNGGIREQANLQEEEAARERHMGAVAAQQQHIQEARTDRALRASDNHGKPPIAATDRPGQFRGGNVVAAKEGKYNPPPNRGGNNGGRPDNNRVDNRPNNRPSDRPDNGVDNRPDRNDRPPNARGPGNNSTRPTYVHPNEAPKANRPDRPPSSGNAKADQKYQQRTDNMYKKQEQERQNLQKQQEQQHARAEQQRSSDARRQQMEQQHQQQTQKMEQRHQQQQQKMERQAPKPKQQPQQQQQPPKQQGNPHDKKP